MNWEKLSFTDVIQCFADVAHPPKGLRLINGGKGARRCKAVARTVNGKKKAARNRWKETLAAKMAERRAV